MVSYWAVAVVAFFQIVLRTSFFIEQKIDVCSTAPSLASYIFLIAFLDVLLDICVYPVRYMHLPYICQIAAETIVAVMLTEFGTLVVWCKIEKISCKLCKFILLLMGISPNFYNSWENYILGAVTTATSLIILLFATKATDHLHFMRKRSIRLCRKIKPVSVEAWNKLYSLLWASNGMANCEPVTNCSEVYNTRRHKNNNNSRVRTKASRSRSRGRR